MQPNDEQLKAAEEKEFIRKAIRKIRKTPDVLFSSDPKRKSHEEKLTDLFVSLLAEREAKARREEKERLREEILKCVNGKGVWCLDEVCKDRSCPTCTVGAWHEKQIRPALALVFDRADKPVSNSLMPPSLAA